MKLAGFCARGAVVLLGMTLAGRLVYAFNLPDTGQVKCYNASVEMPCPSSGQAFYGQDGSYTGTPKSYHDNGDGTVTDLVTGLIWEQGAGAQNVTWAQAAPYCAALRLDGKSDWRVPTRKELLTLVDIGKTQLKIDSVFSCAATNYWTSILVLNFNQYARVVSFSSGGMDHLDVTSTASIRCVRGS